VITRFSCENAKDSAILLCNLKWQECEDYDFKDSIEALIDAAERAEEGGESSSEEEGPGGRFEADHDDDPKLAGVLTPTPTALYRTVNPNPNRCSALLTPTPTALQGK